MGVSLEKGGRISLSKDNPGLSRVRIGLGWDERTTDGAEYDLDASMFLLKADGKCGTHGNFVFYENLKPAHLNGAVEHQGDNLTGGGDGDDEVIEVNLADLRSTAPDIEKMDIVVTIHDAEKNSQNFGQVQNAFIRLVNADNSEEIVRYDLGEDYSTETALIFGSVYFKNDEWRFTAVGQGYQGGLAAACENYGIQTS